MEDTGDQEVFTPSPVLPLCLALTSNLQRGQGLSLVGITHIHALVPKGTLVNDEGPAGALGCHAHCLANLQLHTVL